MNTHSLRTLAFGCACIGATACSDDSSLRGDVWNDAGGYALEINLVAQTATERTWKDIRFEHIATISSTDDVPLWGPLGVFAPDTSSAFVVDYGDAFIKEFAPDGRLLRIFGAGRGEGPGEFLNPSDVAIRNDTVVIADGMSQRFAVYARDGHLIASRRAPVRSMSRLVLSNRSDEIVFLAKHQDGMLTSYSYDADLEIETSSERAFARLIDDFFARGSLLGGFIVSVGDTVIVGPAYYGALLAYRTDGTLVYARETVLPSGRLPDIETTTLGGGVGVRPKGRILQYQLSLSGDLVGFTTRDLDAYETDSTLAIDFYEVGTGDYRYSIRVPGRNRKAVIGGRYLYGSTQTEVLVWRMGS